MSSIAPDPEPVHAPIWGHDLTLPIGLGTNVFGRTIDEPTAYRILDAFLDAGGTLIDTADTYSDGAAETVLGKWMRDRGTRDQVVIATKMGNHPRFEGLSAAAVSGAIEESLRRLGTDHVDLYFAHYEDPQTSVDESAAAFDALVHAGKIGAVGLSNFSANTVQDWIGAAQAGGHVAPVALQPHYSLAHREPFETDFVPIATAEQLAVLPYRALGGGFLSGKYRTEASTEGRARGAGVLPMLNPAGQGLLDTLEAIAVSQDARPATVALAWLMQQPTVTAPLVSATSTDQLDELLAAPSVVLSQDEQAQLAALPAP
ncbi:oxidoreductase, aldo/keto reductase family protein [Janibacter sp. HTCC2649]|uniref:aldo/keto reductase n=1 Tax=Janibacter sp. HTCC2649 TaxID=313589 RepID=UPI0000671873|nr:aldo/keto reductase [Janibacter sp. HTCC2649]EAP98088.1 oxidoreductase, aldo/keto reductase family protein [Janibacter sp. HTCC2649]